MYRSQTGVNRQDAAVQRAFLKAVQDKNWTKADRIVLANPDLFSDACTAVAFLRATEPDHTTMLVDTIRMVESAGRMYLLPDYVHEWWQGRKGA